MKITYFLALIFSVLFLCLGVSCDNASGLISSIESETELSEATLNGYISHMFKINGSVYAVNGNLYKKSWVSTADARSGKWESWKKIRIPSKFVTIRHAGALATNNMILALFDEGDSREYATNGLQIYDTTTATWSPANIDESAIGEPYSIFSSSNGSYVYLLTKKSVSDDKYYYHLYEWNGSATGFTQKYESPEPDTMGSYANQQDNYRPRAVAKLADGSAILITKTKIYKNNESINVALDDGIGITVNTDGTAIYAIDADGYINYSTDSGSTWVRKGPYTSKIAAASVALTFVPASAFSAESKPIILVATEDHGYYELPINADKTPVGSLQDPGNSENAGNSSIPVINKNKSRSQYASVIATETAYAVYYIPAGSPEAPLSSEEYTYSMYVSLADAAKTCLWGMHVDGNGYFANGIYTSYSEDHYPSWDRE